MRSDNSLEETPKVHELSDASVIHRKVQPSFWSSIIGYRFMNIKVGIAKDQPIQRVM